MKIIEQVYRWLYDIRLCRDEVGCWYYDIGLGLRLYPWADGTGMSKQRMADLIHPAGKEFNGIVRENIMIDAPQDWLEKAVVRRLHSRYGVPPEREWNLVCPSGTLHSLS